MSWTDIAAQKKTGATVIGTAWGQFLENSIRRWRCAKLTKVDQEGIEVERVVVQQDSANIAHELKGAASYHTAHVSPSLVADALCGMGDYENSEDCEERRVRRNIGQISEDADIESAARYSELAVCARAKADWVKVVSRHDGLDGGYRWFESRFAKCENCATLEPRSLCGCRSEGERQAKATGLLGPPIHGARLLFQDAIARPPMTRRKCRQSPHIIS